MDYDEFLKVLGKEVQRRRRALQKTQEALADEIGVHQSNLSKLEGGNQGFDARTLFNLSAALDVPLHVLFDKLTGGEKMDLDRRAELLRLESWFNSCNDKGRGILLAIAEMTARANPVGRNVTPFRPKAEPSPKRRRRVS